MKDSNELMRAIDKVFKEVTNINSREDKGNCEIYIKTKKNEILDYNLKGDLLDICPALFGVLDCLLDDFNTKCKSEVNKTYTNLMLIKMCEKFKDGLVARLK